MGEQTIQSLLMTALKAAGEERQNLSCKFFDDINIDRRDCHEIAAYGQSVRTAHGEICMSEHPYGFAEFHGRELEDTSKENLEMVAEKIRNAFAAAVSDARARMLPGNLIVARVADLRSSGFEDATIV